MKKLLIIIVLINILLLGCSSTYYKNKCDDNPNYYIDYLSDLGYSNIELITDLVSEDMMNMTYELNGYDIETSSDFIYYYVCYDDSGKKFNAFMPDRVGEENIIFEDFMPDDATLDSLVNTYNQTTDGTIISIEDDDINTLDIILNDEEPSYVFVEDLYVARSVNGNEVNIDIEEIKTLIEDNINSPIIYEIGRYYIYGSSTVKTIYIAMNFNDSYIFLLEDFQTGTLEVLNIAQYFDALLKIPTNMGVF